MWNRFVTISITRDWREDSSLQPSNRHLQHCRVLNNALAFFDAGREKKRTSKHRAPDSLCPWMASMCLCYPENRTPCWRRALMQAGPAAGACAKSRPVKGMRRRCASGVMVGACAASEQDISTFGQKDEMRSFVRNHLHSLAEVEE